MQRMRGVEFDVETMYTIYRKGEISTLAITPDGEVAWARWLHTPNGEVAWAPLFGTHIK
jgi:hypothetical protein